MLRVLWVLLLTSLAWSIPFEQVPNPRRSQGWVSDVAHILNASEVTSFNQQISTLEGQNGTEIAVVILPDCSGREPREYAHRLLNYWGVGKRRIDNGIVFLVAMKERRTEVATGEGVRRFVSDANLKQMLENQVVPHFKASHPNLGVGVGLRWLCQKLTPASYANLPPLSAVAQRISDPRRKGSLVADPDKLLSAKLTPVVQSRLEKLIGARDLQIVTIMLKNSPQTPLSQISDEIQRAWKIVGRDGLFLVSLNPPASHLLLTPEVWAEYDEAQRQQFQIKAKEAMAQGHPDQAVELMANFLEKPKPTQTRPVSPVEPVAPPSSSNLPPITWVGLLGAALGAPALGLRYYLRNRKRNCPQCSCPMTKLDEQADDTYLNSGERDEERLGSVDYDIWLCPNCQLTEKGRYAAWFSGYSNCQRCGFRTMTSTSTTVSQATEYSEGEGRTDYHCGSCGFRDSSTYSIARIQKSESSSSSSSSSDSGSSFGGGSSSGGGAGASW